MASYNPQQQVFSLSWLSNSAGDSANKGGNLWTKTDLQNAITAIQSNIGAWQVVWGPCYFMDPKNPKIAANAIFVAQYTGSANAGTPNYVIAVAGTNPSSNYDWMTEDMTIVPLAWPYLANTTIQVTTGDNQGLTNVLAMSDGSPAKTLQQYLYSIANKGSVQLAFTGHSLGGALSPILMLALMDPSSTLNSKGTNVSAPNWQGVSLLATAGPTPGDNNFVTYFNQVAGQQKNWSNAFIWNGNDVVPHAWANSTMKQLNTLFGLNLSDPTCKCIASMIQKAQNNAAQYSYTQFNSTAAWSEPLQKYFPDGIGWTAGAKFLAQTDYQHINAYVNHFQCTWFSPSNLCNDLVKANAAILYLNNQCNANNGCS